MAVFIQQRPQCVRVSSTLMDQSFPAAEHSCAGLLLNRLGLHKAHFRLSSRDHDRLGIGSVIFWRLTNGRAYCGAISFTSWPSAFISRAQKCAPPQASKITRQGSCRAMNAGNCFRVSVLRNRTSPVRRAPWSWKTVYARSTPIIISFISPLSPLRSLHHHNLGTLRCRQGRAATTPSVSVRASGRPISVGSCREHSLWRPAFWRRR